MSGRDRAAESRAGFTLVEVMVAIIVLTIGVLGLAGTTMYLVRQTTLSELTTERSAALQSVIEELRATPYDEVSSGSDKVGAFEVKWTVTQGQRTKLVSIVTVGPGLTSASGVPALGASVIDTFDYRIMEQ